MPELGAFTRALKSTISSVTRGNQYEEFELPQKTDSRGSFGGPGMIPGVGGGGGGGGGFPRRPVQEKSFTGDGAGSPDSLPEIERPPLRHIDKYIKPEVPWLSKRYTTAILTCMGFMITFGMRCCMGMAKLKFEQRENEGEVNGTESNFTQHHHNHTHAEKKWSVAIESMVDSSFFWGYLVTQVPGGFLASKYPANRIFGTAVAVSSCLNLIVPLAIEIHPSLLIFVRIMQGLVEGFTYPACHGIWRYWAPPLERSRLATIAFCGSYAGIVIGMPLCGFLTDYFSWQMSFYFYGVLGICWFSIWLWLVFERPRLHPTISLRELRYIEESLGTMTNQTMPTLKSTPWMAFFTSMPVYAIIVANFCRSWNFYLLVLFQTKYLKNTFNLNIAEAGIVGALPHLLMTIIVPSGGLLADHIRKQGILSTTMVRKVFNCGGFGMEGLFFLFVAYAKTATWAVIALSFGVAFSGFAISGFNVNHLDIAPRYAAILMGMSNGIGTLAGLLVPFFIDFLTKDQSAGSWKIVFITAGCVHFFGITFYALFASGELQPWAESTRGSLVPGMGDVGGAEGKSWKSPDSGPPPPRPTGPPPSYDSATADGQQPLVQSTNPFTYGATQAASTNPFNYGDLNQAWDTAPAVQPDPGTQYAFTNHMTTQSVQPEATDSYMHGSIQDRAY